MSDAPPKLTPEAITQMLAELQALRQGSSFYDPADEIFPPYEETDEDRAHYKRIEEEHARTFHEPLPNGHDKSAEPDDPLVAVDLSTLAHLPLDPPVFLDGHGFIMMDALHVLNGDGGAGKTDLLCQLAVACRTKGLFNGLPVKQGPVVFYSAEEPVEKILWRIHTICADQGLDPVVAMAGIHVIDRARKEAWLFDENSKKRLVLTKRWFELVALIMYVKPIVFMIDNRMRVLAGNQNDTVMAVDVITRLDCLAFDSKSAGVLASHPSLSQLNNGRGDSGSVSWGNAGRGRSLLAHPNKDREFGAEDDGKRVLTNLKANYGQPGKFVEYQWRDGYLHSTYVPPKADEGIGVQSKAERVFMLLLRWHADKKMEVSPSSNARAKYAPKVFSRHSMCENLTIKWFEKAMEALLHHGKIEVKERGPASHRVSYLVAV